MSLFLGLVLLPAVAGTVNWQASSDGTGGVWSLSCDFTGQDLKNARVAGSACGSTCKATAGCTHYTWTNFNGGTCWMKSGPRFKLNAVDKNDNSVVCGLLPSYSQDWANACDFVGNDLSNAKTTNSQCGPKCQSTSGCTHFTWTSYQGGTCWMKSGPATGLTVKTDNSMVCGVVSGTPPPPPPANGRVVTFTNRCQETIWIQSNELFGTTKLDTGKTVTYNIPKSGWNSGMLWPKVGCDANGVNCAFGQSRAPCPAGGCTPPAETKAEFHFPAEGVTNDQAFYDISLVDGYSLPMTITPRGNFYGQCRPTNCAVDLNRCPTGEANGLGDLRYYSRGKLVACLSPCEKYTWPRPAGFGNNPRGNSLALAMCCPNPPVSSAACNAGIVTQTQYVRLVRSSCPSAYSFSFDDLHATHICNTMTSFDVTVC